MNETKERLSLKWEISVGAPRLEVAGVDEVGRGCLAGPVVAAAVVLPASRDFPDFVSEITDSKKLSFAKREKLFPLIQKWVKFYCISEASVLEIDEINILRASHLAMKRAVCGLSCPVDHVLVDGNMIPDGLPAKATSIIKGDLKCLSIACASILAKVSRDRQMLDYSKIYPHFGFETNMGYGTPPHKAALKALGITPIHRKSFSPVAERLV